MSRKKLNGTYYSRHKTHANGVSLKYYYKNRETINTKRRKGNKGHSASRVTHQNNAKEKVFSHYGKSCLCCGEANLSLLTIDHINNNGKEHGNGKNRYKGVILYSYLINENYPSGIQVLCFNCNIGRKNNGGICPHKS